MLFIVSACVQIAQYSDVYDITELEHYNMLLFGEASSYASKFITFRCKFQFLSVFKPTASHLFLNMSTNPAHFQTPT